MHSRQGGREEADTAQREADPGRGVGTRVGVGKGAVADFEQNEDREGSPYVRGEAVPWVAGSADEEAVLLIGRDTGTEVDDRGVVTDEVEASDQHARKAHR